MPKGKKGQAMDVIPEGKDTFENEVENDFVEKDVSSEKPPKKTRGRPKKVKNVDPSNGEAKQNGIEELKDDASEMSDKNSSKPSSEDDKNSIQDSGEGSENVLKINDEDEAGESEVMPKKKGGKNLKKAGRGRKPAPSKEVEVDENQAEEEAEVVPKKRGGRNANNNGEGGEPAASKKEEADEGNEEQSGKETGDDFKPQKAVQRKGRGRKPAIEVKSKDQEAKNDERETEVESKKRGRRNANNNGGEPAASKKEEADEGNEEQSGKETDDEDFKPQKAAQRKGRGRKPAIEVKSKDQEAKNDEERETEIESKKRGGRNAKKDGGQPAPSKQDGEKTKGTRGRKRKNPPSDTIEEDGYENLSPKDLEEATNVKVSIERQQDIDDMALELMESEGANVKAAAGSSGKGRGRKRASEEESAGTSKKGKAAPAKAASKREKIPDVKALDFDNKSTNAKGKAWNLKIATWNVNGLRAWMEKDGMSYLTHEDPDILCIQETKCSEDKIPPESNPVGYHCYWVAGDKDGYSGVGLMSKKKPVHVEYGIRKKVHDGEGRVITAEYDDYYLIATYVPNAGRKLVRLDYRKQWDIDFRDYLKKLDSTKPIILCGDLNVAHNEIDLANPKTNKKSAGFTQEERDGFSSLLSEGFVDAFRHLYPDTKDAYTFWTYLSNARAKNVGWRLDYFVLSERFTDNLCDCVIRKDVMGSDHCPLVLFLRI